MSNRTKLVFIMILAVVAAVLAYPREDRVLRLIGFKHTQLHLRQGLDLQGGAYLVYQADLSKTPTASRSQAMSSLINVIQKRVNPAGTSEVTVETSGGNRVIVELPGIKDIGQAIDTIGKTAQLTFYELPPGAQDISQLSATGLTGSDLKSATTDIDSQTGQPIIDFTLKSSAVQKFASLTTKINQESGRLVITLDNQIVFNGTVSSPITTGP